MKKALLLLLSFILCIGITACGSSDNSGEPEVVKIEKTVDAVASELGFSEEKEYKAFEMIGANDGAGYGDYEIYIYDENSDAYTDVTGSGYDMGFGVIQSTAANSGVVLIYSGDGEADQTIIDNFNAIEFE